MSWDDKANQKSWYRMSKKEKGAYLQFLTGTTRLELIDELVKRSEADLYGGDFSDPQEWKRDQVRAILKDWH